MCPQAEMMGNPIYHVCFFLTNQAFASKRSHIDVHTASRDLQAQIYFEKIKFNP